MSEWVLVWLIPVRLLAVGTFVTCYVMGGRKKKYIRRYAGPAIFGIILAGIALYTRSFNPFLLLVPPAYMGALCLGYGGDSFSVKLFRRIFYGLALGSCGLFAGWITGHLFLGLVQFFLALIISPLLGLSGKEPAVSEEAEIAMLSIGLVPFMV